MPALDWISISGFRSIASIKRLPLTNINVIVGSNGSGKSNFIGAFAFLHAIRDGRLKEYTGRAGGANALMHFGSKHTDSISFHLSFASESNQYKIELIPTENDELHVFNEVVYYWEKTRFPAPYDRVLSGGAEEAAISRPQPAGVPAYVRKHLDSWRLYHFHDTSRTSPMKQVCDVGDSRFLRSDGSNLASFLYMLKQKYTDIYSLLVKTIQSVAPYFEDFILNPTALNEEKIRLEWRHRGSDAYFSAASLSDGTLRFIALATLLLQPTALRPSVILIDEPELGLHPYALSTLSAMVRQASIQTQVIMSTQSALFLDNFEPSEVLVADRVDNATELKRLSDTDFQDWLEEYSLGQLWEKAEFGGRPTAGV